MHETNNPVGTEDGQVTTIRELIDRMARTNPNGVFLISPETGRELTFQGLQEEARILSARLSNAGQERGGKIAFLLDNSLFTAQLFLGTMYGGFVSVPLNVRAGVSQLAYTLDHSDAKMVFVGQAYGAMLKEVMAHVRRTVEVIQIGADGWHGPGAALPVAEPLGRLEAEDAALLMYTSGSTGQPRAAVHTHASVLAHGKNSVCSHELTDADRSLLVLPMYHINAECVTLLPTLLSGGSVVVPCHFVLSQFWDWLDDYHCTWSALVPTIISQLLDWKDPKAGKRQEAFARIRFLRSSSAPLSPSLHREFLDKFKLPLIQAMGCTEGGNIFSNPAPPGRNKIGSPGLPWGFEARVVNQNGVDLPAGEPGEVLLRGPAMMRGYYKDPVTTAAALDSEGWLHTGDLAYRDEDGYFFVVGRSKELIIKGGMNIAPKQIDEVLESHPAVKEAAAVGVPDRYVGEDVVAFVVFRTGMSCEERELLGFCESRLGHFKTPTRIHFVEDLPKGPSGKVQRLRLVEEASRPAMARSASLGSDPVKAAPEISVAQPGQPAGDASFEQIIAGIWAELLVQPKVDAQANFFALGGHSLLAIQCLSRLRDKVPVMLSLSDFFENATVAEQAALVRKRMMSAPAQGSAGGGPVPLDSQPVPPRDRTVPCPLSPAQKRVWFFGQLAPDVPLYNESEAVGLKGDLNVEALERALNIVVARHEILRSTIQVINEQPVAVVLEGWPLKLKQIDLSGMVPSARLGEVGRLMTEEPRLPYHLQTDPGIRATLIRVGPREHVFILMMHHLVCDWSSEGVLWREMSAAYHAFCRGQTIDLAPLQIQHGDYAAWQQQQMTETSFAGDLAFWEENLRGAPDLLELPTDRPRPPVISYRGARQRFRIDTPIVEALRECSRREKVSLFTVFAAALDVLLYRYTGQEDILVGIPLADRERPELQSVIGFLLHTQVLRTRLTGDMTFRELLAPVQKGVLDLYSHSAVPFDQVVNKLHPERNLSYSPIFQVMLNWRDRDQLLSFIGMDGLAVESLLAESRTSKFDLLLILTDAGDEMWLEIEYSTDLFNDDRMVRMVGHYQTLLEAVAGNPDVRLARVPLLGGAERRQILVDWNQTRQAELCDKCVHEWVAEQAQRSPDAQAVAFKDERLTYRELDERANQVAHCLQKLGAGPDVPVGICVERSLDMVVGVLGILKAGGAYMPLDPEYPKDRLAFMLENGRVPVLLTQKSFVGKIPTGQARVVCMDADRGLYESESVQAPSSTAGPDNLAYIIYTSGSTGQPKGVAMVHRALANLISWQCASPSFSAGLRTLQFASLGFDVSFQEMFSTWCSKGTLVVVPEELRRDFDSLLRFLTEQRVERLFLPFVALEHLAETAVHQRNIPSSLREIITAGEQLQITPDIRAFFEKLPGCTLENQYGPTEAHVVSAYTMSGPPAQWPKLPPIGKPISNASLFVLDRENQPAPIGVPGELHIGGACLARGYLNRPDLTAQKFVTVSVESGTPVRLYKTGDLARFLPDGNIEFIGRSDFQVKIRGFRVELGEIEAALRLHPTVQQAVVVAREGQAGDKRLAAYVSLRDGQATAGDLRVFLGHKLPDYMVPAAVVVLKSLPLSHNGKVDRKALPSPDFQTSMREFVSPVTPTEKVLARLWSDVLGLNQVGTRDNFFDLGGHSLLLVRLQSRVCEALSVRVSIAEMFQYPTISSLAAHLDKPATEPARLQKARQRAQRQSEALGRRREKRASQT